MRDIILIVATLTVVVGLVLVGWRELAGAAERRKVGPVRDIIEVLLPIVATVALLLWVWVSWAE